MKKVVIGMSGGVDSSVAAYLLQKQGYEVIGLFMRNWDSMVNNDTLGNPDLDKPICPQEQDYNDALEVCKKLDIPLHRVDFIKEYWDYVFKYFLDELEKGRTPNPDLMCNKYIKFDLFIKEAKKLGADYVATGHYAKIVRNKLCRATDLNKDQTYFLAQVHPNNFRDIIFPLGDVTKEEVREIANYLGLITADKKDSTGICFIGERNFQKFISNYLKPNPGDIVDIKNKSVIGTHTGLMNYTIGQRRNIGISGFKDKHYVVGKNVKDNILYVAFGENPEYLYSDSCLLEDVNFIRGVNPTFGTAKFRYRSKDVDVILEYLDEGKILVRYPSQVKAVTPGQACVIYLGDECIGSGIIDKIYKNDKLIDYL